ncbi:MAG: hypothetical protein WCW31_01790 [Patescibacteria group bacterium]|jgi:hypothetical protein
MPTNLLFLDLKVNILGGNTKIQTPNKHQTLKHLKTDWCFEVLELGVCLDLGFWFLVFTVCGIIGPWRMQNLFISMAGEWLV